MDGTVLIVVATPFVVVMAALLIYLTTRPDQSEQITVIIDSHIEALRRRRSQILIVDDYGVVSPSQKKKWEREIHHFYTNVLTTEMKDGGHGSLGSYYPSRIVSKMIEDALLRFEGDSGLHTESFAAIKDGLDFEHRCADAMRAAGWSVRTTSGSGDQGADLIATRDGCRVVVQCKFYSRPVGNKAVQEVVAAKRFVGAALAIVVSNAAFTSSARQLAAANDVYLLNCDQLYVFDPKAKRSL